MNDFLKLKCSLTSLSKKIRKIKKGEMSGKHSKNFFKYDLFEIVRDRHEIWHSCYFLET